MNNKYINHLIESSSKHKRRFREFLDSPFHNKNRKLLAFLDIILTKSNITYEDIYRAIFKDEYKKQRIVDLYIQINKLYQKYLSIIGLEEDSMLRDSILVKMLSENSENNLFELVISKTKKNWEGVKNVNKHHFKSELYRLIDKRSLKKGKVSGTELQVASDQIDIHFLVHKLQYTAEMINREKIINEEFDSGLFKHLSTLDWNEYINKSDIIFSYHLLIQLLVEGREETYEELSELMISKQENLSSELLEDLYGYLQNYSVRKINEGETKFYLKLLELFKFQITSGFIGPDKVLSERKYKTIITVGLRLNEYDWTENFIQNYSNCLVQESRENALNYNLSVLNYEKGNIKVALRILAQVQFTDIFYNLDSRILLLKIYYDQNEYESFISAANSLNVFLKRLKKISGRQKRMYANFLKFIKQLHRLSESAITKDKEDKKAALQQSISNTDHISNRNWLLERINEI
ncbi:MAG: hypothetical protein MRY83_00515 [Flavobacteriales bacterium]|nr:hypothetical protein [Flavobacteriales bacterium]